MNLIKKFFFIFFAAIAVAVAHPKGSEAGPIRWTCNCLLSVITLGSCGPPKYLWSSAQVFNVWGRISRGGLRMPLWDVLTPFGSAKISAFSQGINIEITPMAGYTALMGHRSDALKAKFPGIEINQEPPKEGELNAHFNEVTIEYKWDEKSGQTLKSFKSQAQDLYEAITSETSWLRNLKK